MKPRIATVRMAVLGLLVFVISAASASPLPDRLIVSLDAREALHFMDIGLLTSSRYVEVLVGRIERYPEVNAFIHLDAEHALAAAAEADELRSQGVILGPLHGLPVLIKDNIDTADAPTTAGTPSLAENQPTANAPVVQALIDAGAILLGKTNMHELALGITSNNALTGAVANPYDFERIAGGSSGGNGAALAARFAPLAIGTDTGGSVRIPAALNGVVALRPSTGRYPAEGIVPISFALDTAGPMARTIGDLALLDSVLAGGSAEIEQVPLDGLRIGAPLTHFRENLDPAVEAAINAVLVKLEDAGAILVEDAIPLVPDPSLLANLVTIGCELGPALTGYLDEHELDLSVLEVIAMIASPDVAALFEDPLPPAEVCDEFSSFVVPLLRATYELYLTTHALDVVIYPTTPLAAAPIGEDFFVELNGELVPTLATYVRRTHYGSVVGAPVVTLPIGLAERSLPVGIDVMGAPGADRAVLSIADAILRRLAPIPSPPAIEPRALHE